MLAAAREQGSSGPDQMISGSVWLSRLIWHWHTHYGPDWAIAAIATSGVLIWRKFAPEVIGQLLATLIVATLFFACVWVWVEPRNYVGSRPTQINYELYIRSIDEYYDSIFKAD